MDIESLSKQIDKMDSKLDNIITRLEKVDKDIIEHDYQIEELERKGHNCIVWQRQDFVKEMIKDYENNKKLWGGVFAETTKKIVWLIVTSVLAVLGAGLILLVKKYIK